MPIKMPVEKLNEALSKLPKFIPQDSFQIHALHLKEKTRLQTIYPRIEVQPKVEEEYLIFENDGQVQYAILLAYCGFLHTLYTLNMQKITKDGWIATLRTGERIYGKEKGFWNTMVDLEKDVVDVEVTVQNQTFHAFNENKERIQKMRCAVHIATEHDTNSLVDAHYVLTTWYPEGKVIKRIYPNGTSQVEDLRTK